jgi:hypothetical protein
MLRALGAGRSETAAQLVVTAAFWIIAIAISILG